MRTGVDLSQFNTGIDYEAMRQSGVEFAYIRLTEGVTIRDNMAATHVAGCVAAGIKWGPYHFFLPPNDASYPGNGVATQVAFFLTSLSERAAPDMPPAIDVETEDPNGWAALASTSVEWCIGVENATHFPTCTYYCNVSFARNLRSWPFSRNPWLADPTTPTPVLPCLLHQLAPGRVSGSPDPLDIDKFLGTTAQWANFTGGVPAPAPIPVPVPTEGFTMQTTDPVSGTIVATDAEGNLYARSGALPAVPTLSQHPTFHAGTGQNPCVGIVFEKPAGTSTFGITFVTKPASGVGGFGPYNLYHFLRTGQT